MGKTQSKPKKNPHPVILLVSLEYELSNWIREQFVYSSQTDHVETKQHIVVITRVGTASIVMLDLTGPLEFVRAFKRIYNWFVYDHVIILRTSHITDESILKFVKILKSTGACDEFTTRYYKLQCETTNSKTFMKLHRPYLYEEDQPYFTKSSLGPILSFETILQHCRISINDDSMFSTTLTH